MRKRFNIDDNEYFLEFTMDNIERLEEMLGLPITSLIATQPTIKMLRVIVAEAIKSENGKVSKDRGIKLAEPIIREIGLTGTFEHIVECIIEDCGFLFN